MQRERRRKNEPSIYGFIPQVNSMTRAGPHRIQELRFGLPRRFRDTNIRAARHCVSRCIRRELDWRWTSRNWTGTHVGCWHQRPWFNPLHHNSGPSDVSFISASVSSTATGTFPVLLRTYVTTLRLIRKSKDDLSVSVI